MVRLGEPEDGSFIASYDVFAGDRARDIEDGRLYVYEKDARPVGYLSVGPDGFHGYPYVQFLAVHPDWRRMGVASGLLSHCESMRVGARLFISTESNNQPMLRLLEAREYLQAGSISGLSRGCGVQFSGEILDALFGYRDPGAAVGEGRR